MNLISFDPKGNVEAPAGVAGSASLSLSVVIPLLGDRGFALRCVESWIDQSLAAERFEIVALSPAENAETGRSVRARLRGHDQFIVHPTDNPMELFDLGARRARGEFIVFTESHCLANRSTLAAFLDHVGASGEAGAFSTRVSGCTNALARAEAQLFARGFAEWTADGGWNRFYVRGTVLRRSVYLAAGGIVPKYGCFAEPAFAAALHAGGFRLGYARKAVVQHFHMTAYREFYRCARDFAHGQCQSYNDAPDHFIRYHGRLGENDGRTMLNPRLGRVAWRDAARLLLHVSDNRVRRRALQALAATGLLAAVGLSPKVLASRLSAVAARMAMQKLRLTVGNVDSGYERAWLTTVVYERLRWATESLVREPRAPIGPGENQIATIPDAALFGFHGLEDDGSHPFRWTGGVALVQTMLPPGFYAVTINTRDFRGIEPGELTLSFGGRLIAKADTAIDRSSIRFALDIAASGKIRPRALMILCDPLPSQMKENFDPRALGVPIASIRIQPDVAPGVTAPA